MVSKNGMTPTERRLVEVFKDGDMHAPFELKSCLHDDLGDMGNVAVHITKLRKKLRPKGLDVMCQRIDGFSYYRMVRLLKKE